MTIVVTGAAGFVGSHLLDALDQAGFSDVIPTAKTNFTRPDGRRFRALDITQRADVQALIRETKPTHVVHLAAVPTIAGAVADPAAAWGVNVIGTLELARAVLRYSPDCTFIFAGSAEAYGASAKSGIPLKETDLLQPLNEYAATKAAADLALGALAANGLKAIRLRPFNHTGPGQSDEFVIPAFATQIARIENGAQPPIIKVGNLDAQRDFLDVRDVVAAYLLAIAKSDQLQNGMVLNIASGQARSIRDVLQRLLTQSEMKIDVVPDRSRQRPSDLPISVGDAAFAKRVLGWSPQRAFDQTLRDVLNHHRNRAAS